MNFTQEQYFNPYGLICACKYFETECINYGSILTDNDFNNFYKHHILITVVLYPTYFITSGEKEPLSSTSYPNIN